jgi:hypothetical protein
VDGSIITSTGSEVSGTCQRTVIGRRGARSPEVSG